MKSNRFYCYALCDPRKPGRVSVGPRTALDYEPFYIGYGQGNRCYDHARIALQPKSLSKPKKTRKTKKILKIVSLGLDVIVVRTSLTSQVRAKAREIELIEAWGRLDLGTGILTNHTDGGEGLQNVSKITRKRMHDSSIKRIRPKHSLETRRKQSRSGIGKPKSFAARLSMSIAAKQRIRKPHSEATKQKMRQKALGRKHTEATKRLIGSQSAGRIPSDETRKRMSIAQLERNQRGRTYGY